MPLRFLMVCEAEADYRLAAQLAERTISDRVVWIDDDLLAACPIWYRPEPGADFLKWTDIKTLANREGLPPVRGAFGGRRGDSDGQNAKRVIRLYERWKSRGEDISGIVLIKDHDGEPERLDWFVRARDSEPDFDGAIVIGIAQHERECWVLAGFQPADQREAALISDLRRELGFEPCEGSHRLTAKEDHEQRSSKRVLNKLTQGVHEREEACWRHTSLEVLRERGGPSGLTAYLDEVEERLVPLFTGRPPARGDRVGS